MRIAIALLVLISACGDNFIAAPDAGELEDAPPRDFFGEACTTIPGIVVFCHDRAGACDLAGACRPWCDGPAAPDGSGSCTVGTREIAYTGACPECGACVCEP